MKIRSKSIKLIVVFLLSTCVLFQACSPKKDKVNGKDKLAQIVSNNETIGFVKLNLGAIISKLGLENNDMLRMVVNNGLIEQLKSKGIRSEQEIQIAALFSDSTVSILAHFEQDSLAVFKSSVSQLVQQNGLNGEFVQTEIGEQIAVEQGVLTIVGKDVWVLVSEDETVDSKTMKEQFASVFNAKETKGVLDNKKLVDFIYKKDDLGFMFSASNYKKNMHILQKYLKNSKYNTIALNTQNDSLFHVMNGVVSYGTLNFNNGELLIESENITTDAYDQFFKEIINGTGISSDKISLLSLDKAIVSGSFNINLEAYVQLMKDFYADDVFNDLDKELAKIGTTKEDLASAVDGEIGFSLVDVQLGGFSANGEAAQDLVLVAGVKNWNEIDKVINKAKESNPSKKMDGYISLGSSFIVKKENQLIITSRESTAKIIASSSSYGTIDTELAKELELKPMFINVDFDKLPFSPITAAIGDFKSITIEGNAKKAVFSLKLKDQNKNALATIVETVMSSGLANGLLF